MMFLLRGMESVSAMSRGARGLSQAASLPETLVFKNAALLTIFALAFATPCFASDSDSHEPYAVSVWARLLFGPDGKPAEYAIVDEDKYPAKFVENVKVRLARAVIPPPHSDGKPTTLRTGVELRFTVTRTAQGGSVRVDGIAMGPLPVKQYFASYPRDVAQSGGWQGDVTGVCTMGVDGRCRSIEVAALPGIPESVRKFMRASLEGWEFEPQLLDGHPIEGQYTLRMRLNTLDDAPEYFREDKFLRVLRSR